MNRESDFFKIIAVSTFILMSMFLILVSQKLNIFDLSFVSSLFFLQIIFIISLVKKKKKSLHILHVLIFIYFMLGIFANNKCLIIVILVVLLIIQVFWILYEKCILSQFETHTDSGYGKNLSLMCLLYTVYLSIRLGSK